ncbi:MAG: hypothetical protein AB7J28_02660 [Hyphomonadaceae bacterium]
MRFDLRHIAAGLALALLAACATPTPYAPSQTARGYGYTETQIEQNRVRLGFRGNTLTDRETVETYLLYRAAELSLERGYDYFVIVDRDTDADRRVQQVGGSRYYPGFYPSWRYYSRRFGWRPWYDPFFDDPVSFREVTQYEANAEVAMFRGERPRDDANAFNAREVESNLRARVVRPAPAR